MQKPGRISGLLVMVSEAIEKVDSVEGIVKTLQQEYNEALNKLNHQAAKIKTSVSQ